MDHFRRSKNPQLSRGFVQDVLGALSPGVGGTGAAILDGAELVLFTAGQTDPDQVVGDFTLSALSGTPAALTFVGPINLPNNKLGLKATASFVAGADPTEETITGYAVTNGAGDTVHLAELFEDGEECAIAIQGDYVEVDVVIPIPMEAETGLE